MPAAEIQVVLCDTAVGCSATFGLATNRGDGDAKEGAATPSSMPMTPLDRTEVAVCGEPMGDNASGSSSPTGSTAAVPLGDAGHSVPDVAPPQEDDAKQQLETLPVIADHGVTAPAMELEAAPQPAQPQPTSQVQPPEAAEQVEVPAEEHEPEGPKAPMPASAQEQEDQSSGASLHGEVATSMASPSRKRSREEDGAEGEDAISADAAAVPMPLPSAAEPPVLAAECEINAGTAVPEPSVPADGPDAEAPAVAAPVPEAGEPLPREAAAACEALGSV
jgi:hypothetical protein